MIYRPRMACIIESPVGLGDSSEVVTFPVRPRSASVEFNSHNRADELELSVERADAGIDPRFLRDANVAFYLGNADDFGEFTPDRRNLRFVGIAQSVERTASDAGHSASIKAQDYTSLFLGAKPFPTAGVPTFQDTLVDAWQKVCDHTGVFSMHEGRLISVVAKLRDRIEFRGGVDPATQVGKGVSARIARQGRIVVKNDADAWDVWQQCIGSLGLISFIELDTCVVTTTADHFSDNEGGVPLVVWGKNLLELREAAHGGYTAKGVGISSFNPLTGTTIEAVYPPPDDPRIQKVRAQATKKRAAMGQLKSDAYDWYEYHAVTDKEVLTDIARRTWEERSRQEMEGSFTTAEMQIETADRRDFDLLNLKTGDSVRVELDPSIDVGAFARLESDNHRFAYLVQRGYAPGVATVLAKSAKQLLKVGLIFKTKTVRPRLETEGDSGTFSVDVTFWNRIDISAAA